jgi:hypothetical protein
MTTHSSTTMTVSEFNAAARQSGGLTSFVSLCENALVCLPGSRVTIDDVAIDAFAAKVKPATGNGYGWNDYISPRANEEPMNVGRVFHEMAAIVGQMGGFFEQTATGIRKWEVGGSGAKAMVEKMANVRQAFGAPGESVIVPHKLLSPLHEKLTETPFAEWRADALMEFMPFTQMGKTLRLVEQIRDNNGVLQLDFAAAQAVTRTYPTSFGGDPFNKKANLLLLMMAAHIDSRPDTPMRPRYVLNTIAAADYRLPQALSAPDVGILKLDDALQARLQDRSQLLDLNDPDVVKLRVGAVVALHRGAQRSGRSIAEWEAPYGKPVVTLRSKAAPYHPCRC